MKYNNEEDEEKIVKLLKETIEIAPNSWRAKNAKKQLADFL